MTARRAAALSTRAVLGVVAVVAVVGGVTAAALAPWPSHRSEPVATAAEPAPADTVLSCDGPLVAAGRLADQIAALSVAADAILTDGSGGAAPAEPFALAAPEVTGSPGVPALVAPAEGREVPLVAAASSASVTAPDLRGLAADACRPALFDSWLVGGAAITGSADLVLIANPGEVASTVDITVFGTDGPVIPPGGEALTVPPKTQRVVPLSGLALGQSAPVVRVAASGAPVRAALQSSLVQTLEPLGVDQQSAIAAAATTQVVPNVVVTTPPGQAGASDATTVLRVLAPGSDATATVRVVPLGAGRDADESSVSLTAGVPVEVELGGLAVGRYAVVVEADREIVAAVWQSAGADFAWLTSAPPLTSPSAVAVPDGPEPVLQIANPGDVDAVVSIRPLSGGGSDRSVQIPAGSAARVAVPSGSSWLLDPGEAAVHAGVTLSGADAVAGYAVWSPDAQSAAITVYP